MCNDLSRVRLGIPPITIISEMIEIALGETVSAQLAAVFPSWSNCPLRATSLQCSQSVDSVIKTGDPSGEGGMVAEWDERLVRGIVCTKLSPNTTHEVASGLRRSF
jgi:hypothetical protein